MAKIGRNAPCPCGSGKKLKKCCGEAAAELRYTSADRQRVFDRLDAWIEMFAADEARDASVAFWGRFRDDAAELPPHLATQSKAVEDLWFAFDDDEGAIADAFMADSDLDAGERAFVTTLRRSSMRLYEVVDVVPGVSLKLRDALEGTLIVVTERSGSRSLGRYEYIAARVVPCGPSGGPELEAGVLHIPGLIKDAVVGELREHRARHLDQHRGGSLDAFYKQMPPFFHDAWAGSFLDANVPIARLDREDLVPTKVEMDIVDATALECGLDAEPSLSRAGASWTWSGTKPDGTPTALGTIERRGDRLVLDALTAERAARGRAMIETAVGSAIAHRATVHESVQRAVKDRIRSRYLRGDDSEADTTGGAVSPEIAEAVVLGHYAKHYRAWIDEPVPALDGKTPREGARDPRTRERAIELVQGLVAIYQNALRHGQPAYDPSWMWAELGLVDEERVRHPPRLVYERVANAVAGSADLVREAVERVRAGSAFDEATDLELQRFVRGAGLAAKPYVRMMVEYETHLRKTFWVDEALAYMLDQTELDVAGEQLRAPFPAFALVFTDRHVLSLAERVLARDRAAPLAGQLLRVLTVHVTERADGPRRVLSFCFAFDALGADLPALARHELELADDTDVRGWLDQLVPAVDVDLPDTNPLRGLLRTTINAILYATSANVAPESPPSAAAATARWVSSEEVYYLPGTIDISQVRRLQELERAPQGRALLRRHMVRGHWRRAAVSWSDQRLRWIEPYWKGPDMAAIIEHAYRLKP